MHSIFQKRRCLTQREVERYLTDELGDDQRYDIENHLLDCELCSAAVAGYAQSQDFSPAAEDLQELRSQVAASAKAPLPPPRLGWINSVAAVVIALALAYAGYLYWNATRPAQLFAGYYEPAVNTYITYRSAENRGAGLPRELEQALAFYDAEDFGLSLPHFSAHLEHNPNDPQALLLAASAHLQAGRAEQAEQYLLRLEGQSAPLRSQASWYLALAYLKQGKTAPAQAELKKILAEPASPFRERAGKLLEEL